MHQELGAARVRRKVAPKQLAWPMATRKKFLVHLGRSWKKEIGLLSDFVDQPESPQKKAVLPKKLPKKL